MQYMGTVHARRPVYEMIFFYQFLIVLSGDYTNNFMFYTHVGESYHM